LPVRSYWNTLHDLEPIGAFHFSVIISVIRYVYVHLKCYHGPGNFRGGLIGARNAWRNDASNLIWSGKKPTEKSWCTNFEGSCTSTDVFDVGETVELAFPAALRNHPDQHDLVISAFVEGFGGTDNATVQVEASSDGSVFTIIDIFSTDEARSYPFPDWWENDFRAVKHFFVELGAAQNVTHIRLTNLTGTSEGLRLDSIEGLHPVTNSTRAFEVRIERFRGEVPRRFKIRIKNMSDPTGVPVREWNMDRTGSLARLEDTFWPLVSVDGDFICITNCILDNNPDFIPFSNHVWSVDGTTEAAPGLGLDPGRQAATQLFTAFDTDGGVAYLSGFKFTVTFVDGFAYTFDYDADVSKEIGNLYQRYQYFDSTPQESGPRTVDYYQFVD